MRKLYEEESIRSVADAIRQKNGSDDKYRISDMPDAIRELSSFDGFPFGGDAAVPPIVEWVRPAEWPDLDALPMPNDGTSCAYFTLDKTLLNKPFYSFAVTGGSHKFETGQVINGAFVANSTIEYTGTAQRGYRANLTESDPRFMIVKISGVNTSIYLATPGTPDDGSQAPNLRHNPIVEAVIKAPTFNKMCSGANNPLIGIFCQRLKVEGLTTKCTAMDNMCYGAVRLRKVEFINCNTSKVTTLNQAFYACTALQTLDLSEFSLDAITHLGSLVRECYSLQQVRLPVISRTSNLNIANMFQYCTSLSNESIRQVQQWHIKPSTMADTFERCQRLESLDLSNWNLSACTSLAYTFNECINMRSLTFGGLKPTNLLTSMYMVFTTCRKLEEIDLSGWDVSNVTTFQNLFYNCTTIREIDLTGWSVTSKCTEARQLFNSCYSLSNLKCDFTTWDVSNIVNISALFQYCRVLDGEIDLTGWHLDKATTVAPMFEDCYKIKRIKVAGLGMSNATSFASMFRNCYAIEQLDLTGWDTRKSTSFANMFNGCTSLKKLTADFEVTSACTTITSMFAYCASLPQLDFDWIRSWSLQNVTTIANLFQRMHAITDIDIHGLSITNKCTSINYLVDNCESLKKLDMSGIDVSGVATMTNMFSGVYGIEELNMSGLDFIKATSPAVFNVRSSAHIVPPKFYVNHNIATWAQAASHDDLVAWVQALPKVTTARTLTLTEGKKMLTNAEIAIATQKGWTIA